MRVAYGHSRPLLDVCQCMERGTITLSLAGLPGIHHISNVGCVSGRKVRRSWSILRFVAY